MKKRDLSDTMINKKLTCEALISNDQQLLQIYHQFFNKDNKLSITNTVNQMRGFNHECHESKLRNSFYSQYFKDAKRFLS